MQVTGRDIEEQELALKFNPSIGNWTLMGDAREWTLSEQRRHVIDLLRDMGPLQPKAVADELGEDRAAIRQTMARMAKEDQLTVVEGLYSLPENLSQVSQVSQTGVEGVTAVTGVTPIQRVKEIQNPSMPRSSREVTPRELPGNHKDVTEP